MPNRMRAVRGMLASAACLALLSGCGTDPAVRGPAKPDTNLGHAEQTAVRRTVAPPGRWPEVDVRTAGRLPVAVLGNALACGEGGRLVSVGGFTGVASIAAVYPLIPSGAAVRLPARLHDAAAGFIGSDLYVFGGGQNASYRTIVRIRDGRAQVIGELPLPLSDAVCVPYQWQGKQGLVLIGGYDGVHFNRTVRFFYVSAGHLRAQALFTLPQGVRYPGVAVSGQAVYVAGGRSPAGISSAVYVWRPGQPVHRLTRLPYGVQKAAAFTFGGKLFIVGGLQAAGTPTSAILGVDVQSGRCHVVGRLPHPLADMGYAQQGARGFLAGGMVSPRDTDVSPQIFALAFAP